MTTKSERTLLSRAVQILRKRLGLTQVELARRINRTPTTVARYETGQPVSLEAMAQLRDLAEQAGYQVLAKFFSIASKSTITLAGDRQQLLYKFQQIEVDLPGGVLSVPALLDLYDQGRESEINEPTKRNNTAHAIVVRDSRARRLCRGIESLVSANNSEQKQHILAILEATLAPYIEDSPKAGST